eukprot:CAMPEP_0170476868 /NCGR_PEP_ID=MMETSP0123-20130129/18205_1 /TAXON_ID=182087 /ORGANISM="Favella ehrenbergii, Strain Fehren 1" /LENGTH=50 /DNA_ID=CAMNT_0010748181 /DNA_START=361 /DNA_END=510 /DNA_ORIENTATION=+
MSPCPARLAAAAQHASLISAIVATNKAAMQRPSLLVELSARLASTSPLAK